jgi:two-component system nitrate/nitrite response regulator NarL
MPSTIGVAVISSHRLFREALSVRLAAESGIQSAAVANNVAHFAAISLKRDCDVVLIDLNRGFSEGVESVWQLKGHLPNQSVIVLAVDGDEPQIVTCLEAGADAYVSQETPFVHLLTTIRAVHRGQVTFSPRLLVRMIDRIRELSVKQPRAEASESGKLTAREVEVVDLIRFGLLNKEISRNLGISLATTKNHVHHILHKLQCRTRREVAAAVAKRGMCLYSSQPAIGQHRWAFNGSENNLNQS